MAKQNKKENQLVKHNLETLNKVREHKDRTGVPVATFYDKAAEEKLKKQQIKK